MVTKPKPKRKSKAHIDPFKAPRRQYGRDLDKGLREIRPEAWGDDWVAAYVGRADRTGSIKGRCV